MLRRLHRDIPIFRKCADIKALAYKMGVVTDMGAYTNMYDTMHQEPLDSSRNPVILLPRLSSNVWLQTERDWAE